MILSLMLAAEGGSGLLNLPVPGWISWVLLIVAAIAVLNQWITWGGLGLVRKHNVRQPTKWESHLHGALLLSNLVATAITVAGIFDPGNYLVTWGAVAASVGLSAILFRLRRFASGVKESVYDDEVKQANELERSDQADRQEERRRRDALRAGQDALRAELSELRKRRSDTQREYERLYRKNELVMYADGRSRQEFDISKLDGQIADLVEKLQGDS
jgi:hypothetical protein